MDAIVLVGGQGTRLRPLTATRHKSLVPLLNRPAIEYLFDWLARSGIDRVVLALGQSNEDLAARYPAGRRGAIEIVPIAEKERLESGGAIRHAVRTAGIEGRFVVLNGDVYADFDFHAAFQAHVRFGADLTLALHEEDDPSQFGVAVVDAEGLVTGFVEKPPRGEAPSRLVNAGVWIFEPGLVDEIPAGAVRVEETLFPSLVARRRRVLGYRFEGHWADLGTPRRYLALSRALLGGANDIAAGASIAGDAEVAGSALGPGSAVGSCARVVDSILWEGVTVGTGAVVERSILADGVTVGEGATAVGVIAGKGASIGPGTVVPDGTSIDPGGRYDGSHG
ncbi:MAG TPA: NDP-sugar synthase [Tepidiformaceae bacterium]|nr:NDP-sugar synthase [Tepidiformaceae bacterium]